MDLWVLGLFLLALLVILLDIRMRHKQSKETNQAVDARWRNLFGLLGGMQEDLDKLMQKTPKTKRLAPVKRIRRPRYRFRRPTVL